MEDSSTYDETRRFENKHLENSLAVAVETALFSLAHGDDAWRTSAISMVEKTILRTTHHPYHDVEVRIAPALFRRFAKASTDNEVATWTLQSSFGVERDVTSPVDLAVLLLPELEHQCKTRNIARHVRIAPKSSFICIATLSFEQRLQDAGLLPCPICSIWSASNKSMWWHLQQQHETSHHEATETATYHECRHSTALIVYEPQPQVPKKDNEPVSNNSPTTSIETFPHSCSRTPWDAVKSGCLDELQRLLRTTTFNVHTDRDRHGSLLLHWATGGGYLEITKYLIKDLDCDPRAAQVGHRSFAGRTPLHWAARNGHVHVVDYLLTLPTIREHLDAPTEDGTTAFCWAAWQGHQEVLERLWVAGCNVQSSNRFGCNASLWAAQGMASATTLEWLSRKGCSATVVNHSKHGVLHKAAQRRNRDICEWFVNHLDVERFSWDVIGPDCDGAVPSDLAGMEGDEILAQWLSKGEMTLVARFSTIYSPPDWLTPYSSHVRFDWEPGGGVLRMCSVYRQSKQTHEETEPDSD